MGSYVVVTEVVQHYITCLILPALHPLQPGHGETRLGDVGDFIERPDKSFETLL